MPTLEQRVSELEGQVRRLLDGGVTPEPVPWWETIYGTFANSEGYEEAMRLGREYRESLRPKADEDEKA